MKLPVRSRQILGPTGRSVQLRVFCPGQRRSFDYVACSVCPRTARVPDDPGEPGATLDCSPPTPSSAAIRANGATDSQESLGALARPEVTCIHRDLSVDALPAAFAEGHRVELPVVDADGHLLGTVWRDDFAPASWRAGGRNGGGGSGRRAFDRIGAASVLHESFAVERGLEALATRRARTLVLVTGESEVVGMLSDIELLQWVTAERRRASQR
jgi:CBS-domain-containing membrane protein